jgi:antitoxin (DNA-binding transcriptional repressor) of toxin-antitoxin stability system
MHRATGEVLDRVAAGEELLVERHGVPIARLVPVSGPAVQLIGAGAGRARQLIDDVELMSPIVEEM